MKLFCILVCFKCLLRDKEEPWAQGYHQQCVVVLDRRITASRHKSPCPAASGRSCFHGSLFFLPHLPASLFAQNLDFLPVPLSRCILPAPCYVASHRRMGSRVGVLESDPSSPAAINALSRPTSVHSLAPLHLSCGRMSVCTCTCIRAGG